MLNPKQSGKPFKHNCQRRKYEEATIPFCALCIPKGKAKNVIGTASKIAEQNRDKVDNSSTDEASESKILEVVENESKLLDNPVIKQKNIESTQKMQLLGLPPLLDLLAHILQTNTLFRLERVKGVRFVENHL